MLSNRISTENTFLIIDVSNAAYRSAYANSTLHTSRGKFSGHVFGTVSSILAVIRNELKGTNVVPCFCYDGKNAKDYRRTIVPSYKANREPRETNPLPDVEEVLRLWPGIHIKQDDKEGDDAMAYAVNMRQGKPCVVYSGDKDLWGLLQFLNCRILSPNLKRFVTQEDVLKHFLLINKPENIYLAKALFGDPSDGIKGVERLTKKQVEPFLNAANITPETFYRELGTIQPIGVSDKNWEKLQSSKQAVFDNYQIIIPQLSFNRESVVKVNGGYGPLLNRLAEYECVSLIGAINNAFNNKT